MGCGEDHLLDIFLGGFGQAAVYQVHCILTENTVGPAIRLHLEPSPLHLGRVLCDTGKLQGFGVDHTRVAAGPYQANGMFH